MDDIVLLEWTFKPKDFFEENIVIERDNYKLIITDGKVEAHIDPSSYDPDHKMREILHEKLNNKFLGVQLVSHKPYELSKPSMCRLHSDGRKDVTIFAESATIKISVGSPDLIVKDKNGNIIRDSRKERIEKKRNYLIWQRNFVQKTL